MDPSPHPALAGRTVAVTAHRRAQEQGGAFERHGARVLLAPALKLAPVAEDDAVVAAARQAVASPPDTVLVTTGYGLGRWLTVAGSVGLEQELLTVLRGATVLARGAKAKGQLQALGIPCAYTGASGRTAELVDRVLAEHPAPEDATTPPHQGSPRPRVLVQLHGTADEAQLARLRAGGLDVRSVAPYRWESADEGSRLARLARDVVAGSVDYVTFTAAPAVDALFDAARAAGAYPELVAALRTGRCTPVAIGPVCVQPLEEAGIHDAVVPERFRLGAMVRAVCQHASEAAER